MAAPTLLITLTTSSTCDDITLTDSTANYGDSTITTASITGATIRGNLSGGTYLLFTFTITSNVITAATLSLSGATAVNIYSSLASTVFPFVASPFSIWRDYGVTVPEFADGVVDVVYTITGSNGDTPYSYTTSKSKSVLCSELCCCLESRGAEIDPSDCCEDCLWEYLKAQAYSDLAVLNTNIGNTTRAALFITKAQELCECDDCGDC